MAVNTDLTLRHQVIYSVFVRGHTKEGTFRALEGDLDRLKGLGTDILWLMPIHPIGEEGWAAPTRSGTTVPSIRIWERWRICAIWWTPSMTGA